MGKIIYTENDSGLAVISGYGLDDSGRIVKIPQDANIEGAQVTTIEQAQLEAAFIPSEELQSIIKSSSNPTPQIMHNNGAFAQAENAQGALSTTRLETQGFGPFLASYNLVFANASLNEVNVLITGSKVLQLNTNLPPLPDAPDFTINGTVGANSLAQILAFLERSNMNLHKMQITATKTSDGSPAPDAFDSANLLQSVTTDLNGNLTRYQQNFQITQDGSQYNQNIRLVSNFRGILGNLNGLQIKVPAGRKLSMNFDIYSIGGAEAMTLYAK